ncbi:MAG TPA: hypothetical protein VEO54_00725 [Thermoanaerobaculia bacterium]|nr:hypothetical protein [Thermoanaerobaculia bacterium]
MNQTAMHLILLSCLLLGATAAFAVDGCQPLQTDSKPVSETATIKIIKFTTYWRCPGGIIVVEDYKVITSDGEPVSWGRNECAYDQQQQTKSNCQGTEGGGAGPLPSTAPYIYQHAVQEDTVG